MTIIEQLKQNEKPYCRMSSEMKCKSEKIRKATQATCDFTKLNISGVFLPESNMNEFCLNSTYRLRADYTEDEHVMLTTADFEVFEANEEDLANIVGHMLDTIRRQHDELVRLKK